MANGPKVLGKDIDMKDITNVEKFLELINQYLEALMIHFSSSRLACENVLENDWMLFTPPDEIPYIFGITFNDQKDIKKDVYIAPYDKSEAIKYSFFLHEPSSFLYFLVWRTIRTLLQKSRP